MPFSRSIWRFFHQRHDIRGPQPRAAPPARRVDRPRRASLVGAARRCARSGPGQRTPAGRGARRGRARGERELAQIVAQQEGLEFVDLGKHDLDHEALDLISESSARRYGLPYRLEVRRSVRHRRSVRRRGSRRCPGELERRFASSSRRAPRSSRRSARRSATRSRPPDSLPPHIRRAEREAGASPARSRRCKGRRSPSECHWPRAGKAAREGAPSQKTCRPPSVPFPSRKEETSSSILCSTAVRLRARRVRRKLELGAGHAGGHHDAGRAGCRGLDHHRLRRDRRHAQDTGRRRRDGYALARPRCRRRERLRPRHRH